MHHEPPGNLLRSVTSFPTYQMRKRWAKQVVYRPLEKSFSKDKACPVHVGCCTEVAFLGNVWMGLKDVTQVQRNAANLTETSGASQMPEPGAIQGHTLLSVWLPIFTSVLPLLAF